MTKFVLITAKHSPEELKQMVERQSNVYITMLDELYSSFKWVEYDLEKECLMWAVLDQSTLEKLAKVYSYFELNWTFQDLTKEALRCDRNNLLEWREKVRPLLYDFITENTTLDTILEKISESGSDSLNEYEQEVLKEASKSL